ncbi:MAG: methyltransferase domain-containing protein [Methyloceanibacter sp.]|nr:methyltransferase domain-containing protein [Methyloceanibacter sp.]
MTSQTAGVNVHSFTDIDDSSLSTYVATLEIFDAVPQLQELKALARARVRPGDAILDVGCGYGIESLQLAPLTQPGGNLIGIDKSSAFVDLARKRAADVTLPVDFRVGNAEALAFDDDTFDLSRVERVLVYLADPKQALSEMRRVTKPGGTIETIEPDFGTDIINVPDRKLARRIRDYECDVNVPQGLLMRDMPWILEDLGFNDIEINTRILVFPEQLAVDYFIQMGANAQRAGVISKDEEEAWAAAVNALKADGRLFATIGYYLFTAKA